MSDKAAEELAVIRRPGYGLRDRDRPFLWFEVQMLGSSALLCFFQPEADDILTAGDVHDLQTLNGRTCVVSREGNLVRFVRFHG